MLIHALRTWLCLFAGLAMLIAPVTSGLSAFQPPVAAASGVLRLSSDLGVPASPDIDVADQLTTILAGVATPATVVLEGMYRIDRPVRITGESGLHIVGGPGTGFVRYAQGTRPAGWPVKEPFYQYVVVRDSSNITLEGFTIQGPLAAPVYNSTLEFAHGVAVVGPAQNILVKGLTIRGVHGDFVMVNEGAGVLPSNVTFENIRGEIAGRQASTVAGGNGVTYRAVTFLKSARSGLDLEPANALGVLNVTVEDSTFKDFGNFCLAIHPRVHNVTIRRTSCVGGRGLGKFGPPANYTGSDNTGLVLEDVRYDWRGTRPANASPGSIIVDRTNGISITRVNAVFAASGGLINGTGTVNNSVFAGPASSTPTGGAGVVVCLGARISDVSNVGTGPLAACSSRGTKR